MIIRENRKYIMIPKNTISIMASISIIILIFGMSWYCFCVPVEIRKGIYPYISQACEEINKRYKDQGESIEIIRTMQSQQGLMNK